MKRAWYLNPARPERTGFSAAQGEIRAMISNGERVKSTRLTMAWSQEQLAETSGVSVRPVQRIEQGGIASPAMKGADHREGESAVAP
jgi:ribosome-binding protein aMBF1 (putative translation factor)